MAGAGCDRGGAGGCPVLAADPGECHREGAGCFSGVSGYSYSFGELLIKPFVITAVRWKENVKCFIGCTL